jgi:predicted PurR-regulated permease PerM
VRGIGHRCATIATSAARDARVAPILPGALSAAHPRGDGSSSIAAVTEPAPPEGSPRLDRILITGGAIGIVALAAVVLLPLWAPVVFAVWTAVLLDPLAGRVARLARGRRAVGAGFVTALVGSALVPVGLVLASLVTSVMAFGREILESPKAKLAIERLVAPENGATETFDLGRWIDLAQAHGATAWQAAQSLVGASAWAIVVLFVFFVSLYQFLADGRAIWKWVTDNTPVCPQTSARLARAFMEAGKGLIIGEGLTSLLQAILGVILYAALGVPRAIVLGALTFVASFVPAVGTAVVWGPVALGLALKGDYLRATILALTGLFGISTLDNLTRPLLQRWGGKLELPVYLLLLAAFGGLAAFGPAGLALGPLALRMAREILDIAREQRSGAADP